MNNKAYIIVLLFVAWSLFSWHWYTCWIKGFCGTQTETSVALDAALTKTDAPEVATSAAPEIEKVADCTTYLTGYIKGGAENDVKNVERLEKFLNAFEGEQLAVNGLYEADDEVAVKRFQEKYRADVLTPWGLTEPTGYVYQTTREHINKLYCEQIQ